MHEHIEVQNWWHTFYWVHAPIPTQTNK